MKLLIPVSNIVDCGVWHKGVGKGSTLAEAIAAIGSDCVIINGNAFNMTTYAPNDAYTINGTVYSTGGIQYGYGLGGANKIEYSYLNNVKYPCFIGGFGSRMNDGVITGTPPGGRTQHTVLGRTNDAVYINMHTAAIDGTVAMNEAIKDGCITAINLDGGGSTQYYLPTGERHSTGRPVLNWVWFRVKQDKQEDKKLKILIDFGFPGGR